MLREFAAYARVKAQVRARVFVQLKISRLKNQSKLRLSAFATVRSIPSESGHAGPRGVQDAKSRIKPKSGACAGNLRNNDCARVIQNGAYGMQGNAIAELFACFAKAPCPPCPGSRLKELPAVRGIAFPPQFKPAPITPISGGMVRFT